MGRVTSVVFSPSDRKHIASGLIDRTIRIWDVERRKLSVGPLTGSEDSVNAIEYSPDGTRLVSGSSDYTLRIWNPASSDLLSPLNGHLVNSVAYSLDGSRIVFRSEDRRILI